VFAAAWEVAGSGEEGVAGSERGDSDELLVALAAASVQGRAAGAGQLPAFEHENACGVVHDGDADTDPHALRQGHHDEDAAVVAGVAARSPW
jgi:hypothetical protein